MIITHLQKQALLFVVTIFFSSLNVVFSQADENLFPEEPMQLRGLPKPADLPLEPGKFEGNWESLATQFECPQWFKDAKFGIWAHWGATSAAHSGGWHARRLYEEGGINYERHLKKFGHPSEFGWKDILPLWKAENFDPDALIGFFKESGARFFFCLGVHHDNFDNWDSKYHRWNAVKVGPKKDIVKLWQEAAKKHGMPFGISEHLAVNYHWSLVNKGSDKKGDKAGVPYDGNNPEYVDLYQPPHPPSPHGFFSIHPVPEWWKHAWYRRIYDLVTTYQPDMFDTDDFGLPFPEYSIPLVAHYYNLKMKSNGGKLNSFWTCRKESNGRGTVLMTEFGFPPNILRFPWIRADCLTDWDYNSEAKTSPRTTNSMIAQLVEIVSKGGALLLSPMIKGDGTIAECDAKVLTEIGDWLKVNGEAIYGTQPWQIFGEGPSDMGSKELSEASYRPNFQLKDEDFRFTCKGDEIYVISLGNPKTDIRIKTFGMKRRLVDGAPKVVRLLGYDGVLKWKHEDDGISVVIPESFSGRYGMVFAINGFVPWNGEIRPDTNNTLVLAASEAKQHGIKLHIRPSPERKLWIENWNDPKEWVSWDKARFFASGDYEIILRGGGISNDSPYQLDVGDKVLKGRLPGAGGWALHKECNLGKVTIDKPGVYAVTLRADAESNWQGIQLFDITFKPINGKN